MATAYFTTNNAYDSIVIPEARQALMVGVQGHGKELADFMADDPGDFVTDWSGADMDEGLTPDDYGEVIAYREQGGPVVVLDTEAWAERLAFHGLTA
jgi:hypothetical protein